MKLLSLLRHASATAQGTDDHSRPLSAQGRCEAVDIAAQWQACGLAAPALILSSDALRSRDTAQAVADCFPTAKITLLHELYLAPPDALLEAATAADDAHDHVLIVGHNPAMGQLAYDLGGRAHPLIARGFAPATLATFECSVDAWVDVRARHLALKNAIAP